MELSKIFESDKSSLIFLVWGLVFIAVSGFIFVGIYFFLDTTQTALEGVDCDITGNAFGDSCQELFAMVLYPALAAKSILIYLSYFSIFILVLGILLAGYNSGHKPWMIGVLLVIEMALTYGAIWLSNIYRLLLENEIIRNALIPFTVYNKIMINFPWFVFIISLFSLSFGIVNWQRSRTNTSTGELDY
jgi:hypothetical protein